MKTKIINFKLKYKFLFVLYFKHSLPCHFFIYLGFCIVKKSLRYLIKVLLYNIPLFFVLNVFQLRTCTLKSKSKELLN